MRTTTRPVLVTASTAALGLALALGAPAAGAQDGAAAIGTGSLGATSVGAAEQVGLGSATGSLPGQCAAMGSLGIGDQNLTEAVPGESPGQTVFLVDQNHSSEGSTTTENVEIHWTNTDAGATGTVVQGHADGDIGWIDFQGEETWGAIVDTGPGAIEWTMTATEDGLFLPTLSLDWAGVPTGSTSHPYGGCGGTVTAP